MGKGVGKTGRALGKSRVDGYSVNKIQPGAVRGGTAYRVKNKPPPDELITGTPGSQTASSCTTAME